MTLKNKRTQKLELCMLIASVRTGDFSKIKVTFTCYTHHIQTHRDTYIHKHIRRATGDSYMQNLPEENCLNLYMRNYGWITNCNIR